MEKKTAGLIGALAGLASIGTAQAASLPGPAETMQVSSYADLLKPIANAPELLKASNAALLQAAANRQPQVEEVQYYNAPPPAYYHHHHHHHAYRPPPRYYHHHHHHHHVYRPPPPRYHHHHSGVTFVLPGIGIAHAD